MTTNSWKTLDKIALDNTWKPVSDTEVLKDNTAGSTSSCIIYTSIHLYITIKAHFCARLEVYWIKLTNHTSVCPYFTIVTLFSSVCVMYYMAKEVTLGYWKEIDNFARNIYITLVYSFFIWKIVSCNNMKKPSELENWISLPKDPWRTTSGSSM